jgi:hypothetical protein
VLVDWTVVALRPEAPRDFRHVVVIDPAPSEALEGLALASPTADGSFVHLAWGQPELELAERLLGREWDLRGAIAEIWRALAESGGEADGAQLRSALEGASEFPRTPETAARCVRILSELGLCEWLPDRGAGALRVLSSERTDLGRSRAYGACLARHQEAIRFLQSRAQAKPAPPTAKPSPMVSPCAIRIAAVTHASASRQAKRARLNPTRSPAS